MHLGAIADDLTGATDLALILSRAGFRVVQTVGLPAESDFGDADAVVIALKTRTMPAAEAVALSEQAGRILLVGGATQLFFKYCSTFDSTDAGNIGPVTDALLTLLGATGTIACPAFPANRRTVYRGHLFVGDQLLSDSPMKDHPLTPMRDSNLVAVLQRQTRRPVSLIPLERLADPGHLREELSAIAGIAIVDAVSDADLLAIGKAAASLRLVTGGSGVAMGLPANFGARPDAISPPLPWPAGRAVVLAGSCSAATLAQVQHYKDLGAPALAIDPRSIAAGDLTPRHAVDFVLGQTASLPPLVYSSAPPDIIAQTQLALGRSQAGDITERFLAGVAELLAQSGTTRFIVAGGETSGAVVAALGAASLRIGPEIDPGVPWTLAQGPGQALALALKSGNFGTVDFFSKAWSHLS